MKTWRIPVVWQEMAVIEVVADTLKEAVELAKDDAGTIPIPQDGYFVDGSWEVDSLDIEALRSLYNDDQKDDVVETKKVVHAYWKPLKTYPDEYTCSHCGELLWKHIKTNFCPDCGAVMDLEEDLT